MKRLGKVLLLVSLLSLMVAGSAVDFTCTFCNTDNTDSPVTVNPGDEIKLDGTLTLPSYSGYTLAPIYKWILYDLSTTCPPADAACTTTNGYGIDFVGSSDDDDAQITFNAPMVPGAYEMVLTASWDTTAGPMDLSAPCSNMTCFIICVSDYTCPSCSDIFCDEYLCEGDPAPTFPTRTTSGYCVNWNTYGTGLCYPGTPSSSDTNVTWYLLDQDSPISSGTSNAVVQAGLTTPTYVIVDIDENSDCWTVPNWCQTTPYEYGDNIYQIVMTVWGAPENPTQPDELQYWCSVGTVVMVAEPDAEIGEVTT